MIYLQCCLCVTALHYDGHYLLCFKIQVVHQCNRKQTPSSNDTFHIPMAMPGITCPVQKTKFASLPTGFNDNLSYLALLLSIYHPIREATTTPVDTFTNSPEHLALHSQTL